MGTALTSRPPLPYGCGAPGAAGGDTVWPNDFAAVGSGTPRGALPTVPWALVEPGGSIGAEARAEDEDEDEDEDEFECELEFEDEGGWVRGQEM